MLRDKALGMLACLIALSCFSVAMGQASDTVADLELLKSFGVAADNDNLLQFFVKNSHIQEATTKVAAQPDQVAAAARLLAARRVAGAAAALFGYLPIVQDDWVREEILTCLSRLLVGPGKMDPFLKETLKDPAASRRAAAVYILGRRCAMEQRATVRSFFADEDKLVREWAAQALVGKRPFLNYQDLAAADESLLKNLGLGSDETALLKVLRKRTLKEEDQQRLRELIADLGDSQFAVRARASRMLIKEGTPALVFLRPALRNGDLEVMRRARLCIEEIQRGPGPALPTAAIRLLANQDQGGVRESAAIGVLLDYAPFADDEVVEEEVATALTILSIRHVQIEPRLADALHDPLPARRAVAAQVLAKVGTREHVAGLRSLLDDPVPSVRLRAARGLLLAKDQTALPTLIALLNDAPAASVWQIEEVLQRLAGPLAPMETVADGSREKRQSAVKAWNKWLANIGGKADLASLSEGEAYLGLITVAEYDSAPGQAGGQVWEAGRDGKIRWKIGGLQGAMDAQVLPNGRILIAEHSGMRVTERDLSGAVKWEYRTAGNPIACQRLPNGNTFIGTYNQFMEIATDLRQVYVKTPGPQFYLFSARKGRDGQVVAMTAQGNILRFDPLANKEQDHINVGPNGGWCSVEALPNGRFLVATMNNGQVREIDAAGTVYWIVTMQGAFRATRLPNGHTLVASMTTRIVAEFDRSGNKRWEKTCEGRPWSVRYR